MVSIGVAVGLFGAFGLTRFGRAMLYGVTATDPTTYLVVGVVVVAVSALACYIPAQKATKVDPIVALRQA